MLKPDHVIEVFLHPGDFYFGDASTRIRTILGSCVSITMWHPRLLIGGMCHYLLPTNNKAAAGTLDGRYADDAMQMFLRDIKAAQTRPAEYQVKLFGGGDMFPIRSKAGVVGAKGCMQVKNNVMTEKHIKSNLSVSAKNVLAAHTLIAKYGFQIEAQDLGGEGHRQLLFDIWSGHAWVRKPKANT